MVTVMGFAKTCLSHSALPFSSDDIENPHIFHAVQVFYLKIRKKVHVTKKKKKKRRENIVVIG